MTNHLTQIKYYSTYKKDNIILKLLVAASAVLDSICLISEYSIVYLGPSEIISSGCAYSHMPWRYCDAFWYDTPPAQYCEYQFLLGSDAHLVPGDPHAGIPYVIATQVNAFVVQSFLIWRLLRLYENRTLHAYCLTGCQNSELYFSNWLVAYILASCMFWSFLSGLWYLSCLIIGLAWRWPRAFDHQFTCQFIRGISSAD